MAGGFQRRRATMRVAAVIVCLGCAALLGRGQDPKGKPTLSVRMKVEPHDHCFIVHFYVKNIGTTDQEVETGRGGGGMRVVPTFDVADVTVHPSTFTRPPRRSMRPDLRTLPAGKEILYGTFTMAYPPVEKEREAPMTASIYFRELKATLRTEPQKLKVPAWKPPE
jgi:hypothetical protein